jgi:AhpD family alkylhydroperoxidase
MPRYPHRDPPAAIAATIAAAGAPPLNLYRILANHTPLLEAWCAFAYALRADCTLPRSLREIMILRTAIRHNCAYEWIQHERMALTAGVTTEEIAAIHDWQPSNAFSDRARAALLLTDAMFDNHLGEGTEQSIRQWFSDAEMIELILTAGFYMMVPRVLMAIDANTEGEGDAEIETAIRHFSRAMDLPAG